MAAWATLSAAGCDVFLSERGSEGHACLPGSKPCAEGLICESDGVCGPGCASAAECDDDNGCTEDLCIAGRCSHEAVADGTGCDDGQFCTDPDTCRDGTCGGPPRVCDDGKPCTDDACEGGQCIFPPVADGSQCDDGNACTVDDSCSGGDCEGGPIDCSHLDTPCQRGVCEEESGACAAYDVDDGTECDDGDACTVDDVCQSGQCVGEGLDSDGDGYIDAECGGSDCDDGDADVHPMAAEGLDAAGSCDDGIDNDCDACTDAGDLDCGGLEPCWLVIPEGIFEMGSTDEQAEDDELAVREVEVAGFEMTKTEVTVAQYAACVDVGGCAYDQDELPAGCVWHDRQDLPYRPMNCVTWQQADNFCAWVGGRLPSEAEWEYAARSAGRDIVYPWGDAPATCDLAVIEEEEGSAGCGSGAAADVCSRPDGNSDQGLCDMASNVWEWVWDYYHNSYVGAPNNANPWLSPATSSRALRGGSWYYDGSKARAANRGAEDPERHDCTGGGFRCAR